MKLLSLTLLIFTCLIILAQVSGQSHNNTSVQTNNGHHSGEAAPLTSNDEDLDNDDDDDDDDNDDDDDGDDDDDDDDEDEGGVDEKDYATTPVSKMLDHQLDLKNNKSIRVTPSKARDLGLLTIKAILLGPLIGLTIKAALFRGLFWAIGAYLLHLFFPGVLSALGLGSGLVGFARQAVRPDLSQLLLPHLAHIPHSLPSSLNRLAAQYRQMFEPVVDSIRAIPEGHCRYRAVCETASQLIKNAQSLSNTLQRLSATVYMNLGTEYSKAWLDGIVQKDCATLYAQCAMSPFSMVASRLAEAVGPRPQTI